MPQAFILNVKVFGKRTVCKETRWLQSFQFPHLMWDANYARSRDVERLGHSLYRKWRSLGRARAPQAGEKRKAYLQIFGGVTVHCHSPCMEMKLPHKWMG